LTRATTSGNLGIVGKPKTDDEHAENGERARLQLERLAELEEAVRCVKEGETALLEGKVDVAESFCKQALKLDEFYVRGLRLFAEINLKRKRWDDVIQVYDRVIKLTESTDKSETDLANRAAAKYEKREYAAAIEDCDEALNMNPLCLPALLTRARAKHYSDDFHGAIKDCTEYIRRDWRDPNVWSLRAMAKVGLYDSFSAIMDCNEAIKIDYQHAPAWSTRGDARNDREDHLGCVKDTNKALKLDPRLARTWSNRADARVSLEEHGKAVEDCTQALVLDPRLADAYGRRGEAKYFLGDLRGAIKDCTDATRLNKLDKDAFFYSAEAKFLSGDYSGAIESAEGALGVDPDYDEAEQVVHKAQQAQRNLQAWHVPLVSKHRANIEARDTRRVVEKWVKGSNVPMRRESSMPSLASAGALAIGDRGTPPRALEDARFRR